MHDCTCHPADHPPQPCPRRYALSLCRMEAAERGLSFLGWLRAWFGLRCVVGLCTGYVDRDENDQIGFRCGNCLKFVK